uniref:Spermatogenesis associated 6 n=1 Tax=Hucho hucho TaxID=62062 RepID=A0A4W5JET5_9TELE
MGGLTPQKKKLSSSKMSQKAMKCTVQIKIQAITCPGVVLPNQEDIYLSVCVMGQFKKTLCLPPAFPLLFHENMAFVKTFTEAADPGHIVDLLEADTTSFELIQLVPPEGDILATMEENTREFLYPGPKLTPRAGGPEREMLMKRSICFPGISPKVEFATMSVIEECDGKDSHPQPASPVSSTLSVSMIETPSSRLSSKISLPHSRSTSFALDHSGDFSLLGSYRPKPVKVGTGCLKTQKSGQDCSRTTVRMAQSALAAQSSTPVCGPRSPLLSRSSLRERFHSSESSPSKEIHSRVQKILHTHSIDRKLHFDENGCSAKRGTPLSCEDSLCDSQAFQDRDTPGETSVHLDNGTFWSSQVACYTGKPHRAVFEDSLGLIYKNMYRRALSTT